MNTNAAHPQKPTDETDRQRRVEGVEGVEATPPLLNTNAYDTQHMAVAKHSVASPLAREIDLSKYCNVPRGTTVQVDVKGDRSRFELVCTRRNRWVLEGALDSAELTAVYGDGDQIEKPTRVPQWLAIVAREFGVHEVEL